MAESAPPIPVTTLKEIAARLDGLDLWASREAVVGRFAFFPYRTASLPFGWYHPNGDQYAVGTPQGMVLVAFPAIFKEDWGIVESGGYVSLPSIYDDEGNGLFPRPVDGIERLPGSIQEDAIVNIAGINGILSYINNKQDPDNYSQTGPFYRRMTSYPGLGYMTYNNGNLDLGAVDFDASLQVNTATEVRPRNIGMTPAFYLGV